MGDYSINDAMSKLGIYKSEAAALDALDGKSDGKISKDIFTQASEALAKAEAEASKAEEKTGSGLDLSKWSDVAKSIARTLSLKMGYAGYVYTSNNNEGDETKVNNDNMDSAIDSVSDLTGAALAYIQKHKTIDGFKFTGVPKDVTSLKITVDDYYFDGDNDVVKFDETGNAVIEKVVDGIAIEVHFKYKGDDYAFGTTMSNETLEDIAEDVDSENSVEE